MLAVCLSVTDVRRNTALCIIVHRAVKKLKRIRLKVIIGIIKYAYTNTVFRYNNCITAIYLATVHRLRMAASQTTSSNDQTVCK